MQRNARYAARVVPALALILLIPACGPDELQEVHSLESGPYQIYLLAPRGTLQDGRNNIVVRVLEDGQPVEIERGSLVFTLADESSEPGSGVEAKLAPATGPPNEMSGIVEFRTGGIWEGMVQVYTSRGPTIGTFNVQVDN